MSKETTLSSISIDDISVISQGISGVDISDSGDICGSCTDNTTTEICANCGKEGGNLKSCAACSLVKYCNRDCQASHRPQHKKECKKRVAELHDIELFKQPPPLDDCSICFLRLPFLDTGRRYISCCGKEMCSGCVFAMDKGNNGVDLCSFCRTPLPESDGNYIEQIMKRAEVNDAKAIYALGIYYSKGKHGLPQDWAKALELFHKAADLGYIGLSCLCIGNAYYNGHGVQRDMKKALHYWEKGAMGGETQSRRNLGIFEGDAGNTERAIKHYMIAIKGGDIEALSKGIRQLYLDGKASKVEFEQALRARQAYLDEIRSDQRDEAAAAQEDYKYYE